MRNLVVSVPLAAVLLCVHGCQVSPQPTTDEAVLDIDAVGDELRSFLSAWTNAMNAGDADALAAMFTDDAVRFPPNGPPMNGNAAIRDAESAWHNRMSMAGDEQLTDFRVAGDFVISHGSWSYEITPRDGGESYTAGGYMMDIYQRQPDGSLKLYWNTWTDEGLVDPHRPSQQ